MIIESENCVVPECLTENIFIETLHGILGRNTGCVEKLEISKGSNSGDNYLSNIYRIKMTYTTKDGTVSSSKYVYLIAKCILKLSDGKSVISALDIFGKEKYVYYNILPKLESLIGEIKIAPQCFYTSNETSPLFILEDMKANGYQMADRVTGINDTHCKLVLEKLGQYHAASILLLEKDPSIHLSEFLKRGIFSSINLKSESFEKLFKSNIDTLSNYLSTLLSFENIVNKLKNMNAKKIFERVMEVLRFSSEDINVVSHGDAWINNFLFKYDELENDPCDVVFIDFQGSAISSLGLDLNYFFATSPRTSIVGEQTGDLIKSCYYPAFKTILERHNYQSIPTLDAIKQEIDKKQIYRFFCSIVILPLISLAQEDTAKVNVETLRSQKVDTKVFATKRYLDNMTVLIKNFDVCGFLD